MTTFIQKIPDSKISVPSGTTLCCIGVFTRPWKKRRTLTIEIGDHAVFQCFFFFLGRANDTFLLDLATIQRKMHSRVHIHCHSLLGGTAVSDISARIFVDRTGGGSESFFSHHILLLSDYAHGKTMPSLEILTDDVSARHEASVTALDADDRFYLESRGLDPCQAASLLIRGFLRIPEDLSLDRRSLARAEHLFDSYINTVEYV